MRYCLLHGVGVVRSCNLRLISDWSSSDVMVRLSFAFLALFLFLSEHGAVGESPPTPNTSVDHQVASKMFAVGYIVTQDHDFAQELSSRLLESKLIASVNIIPGVHSLVPMEPRAASTNSSIIVFITRVVNISLIKVLVEAEMILKGESLPFYEIFFTVLADINGEYLELIDKNSFDATTLSTIIEGAATHVTTIKEADNIRNTTTTTKANAGMDDPTVIPAVEISNHENIRHPPTSSRRLAATIVKNSQTVDLTHFVGNEIHVVARRNEPLLIQVEVNAGTGYSWKVSSIHTTFDNVEGPIAGSEQIGAYPGAPCSFWFKLNPQVSGIITLDLVSPIDVISRTITVSIFVA